MFYLWGRSSPVDKRLACSAKLPQHAHATYDLVVTTVGSVTAIERSLPKFDIIRCHASWNGLT